MTRQTIERRGNLLKKAIAETANGDTLKERVFARAIREALTSAAIRNLEGLDFAIKLGEATFGEVAKGKVVAQLATLITEPSPDEIRENASLRKRTENQFYRLCEVIKRAETNQIPPELLAAVVARCEKDLVFYTADIIHLNDLQKRITPKKDYLDLLQTPNLRTFKEIMTAASYVILHYRSIET